ncbi:cell wall metabolism sensor histidine kinase WalK [Alkalihalophilus pseudofirmus]|uniref:cell wall metabolism sensor histidine kinase WalK n=1 Tax=Alkalihalobacterium alkalinitrilicum TaxID=427920 RepID=UPI00094D920A|nr:cell wall metabolism sensor histidine kinase WalK [Alkalihalobacterium alkalinitrilicum]OLO42161.1 cell wall metabolism sensor histidine kinase WalK [Alkalihalophilus pseudofirmus]
MDKKVGFFKSIQFKLIITYVLLIFIAMQIIGVYFIRQLEDQLVNNYTEMLDERANLLAYNVEQELVKPRDDNSSLGRDINVLLREFFAIENSEAQVVDMNKVVLATSKAQNRHIVGQQSTEVRVKRALLGTKDTGFLRDPETGHRLRVIALPVKSINETIGAIYIEASMEEIYDQMQQINEILGKGTGIAVTITAILIILIARTITGPIIDMKKQAHRMGKGDFTGHVRVYGRDEIGQLATSFNELTLKLKEANASTEREKKKLSSVLSHMSDGVIATDQNGNIILMNKRAEQLLETSSEEAYSKPLPDVLRLSETFAANELDDYSESILLDFSDEEQDFLLQASFSVIQKDNGPITGIITVLHDVTEREKIEHERREFVANVSHELRTPLTTLKSYLEALEDGAIEDIELASKFLNVTQNETERMIRLVNDLLQLSKMDSKDYQFTFENVDFNHFLENIVDRFEMMAKEKNIKFVRTIPRDLMCVDIDKDKITQVIDNIISNAIKYSPDGGNISIELLHQGNNLRLSISDEGVGIPRESQMKVFDRFYRVDKARARNIGGTGLGLAIAKELVHAHRGEIWVESEYGQGTTILFTLPYSTYKGGEFNYV